MTKSGPPIRPKSVSRCYGVKSGCLKITLLHFSFKAEAVFLWRSDIKSKGLLARDLPPLLGDILNIFGHFVTIKNSVIFTQLQIIIINDLS